MSACSDSNSFMEKPGVCSALHIIEIYRYDFKKNSSITLNSAAVSFKHFGNRASLVTIVLLLLKPVYVEAFGPVLR